MSEEPWEGNEDDEPDVLADELEEGGLELGDSDDDVWGESSDDE